MSLPLHIHLHCPIEATTHALVRDKRNYVFTAGGGDQTLVADEATFVRGKTTLIPDNGTLHTAKDKL